MSESEGALIGRGQILVITVHLVYKNSDLFLFF